MAFGLSCPADLVPPSHSWVLLPNRPPWVTHRLIMSRNSVPEFSLILNLGAFCISTRPPHLESSLSLFIFDDGRRGGITFSLKRPLRGSPPGSSRCVSSLLADRYASCSMQHRSHCVIPESTPRRWVASLSSPGAAATHSSRTGRSAYQSIPPPQSE